jgi:nitrite reductase/ring-hydroxylating ferredoxin subunit
MAQKEIHLGPESQFTEFPAEIKIEYDVYFLVKQEEGYKLLSADCPHAGGTVMIYQDQFVCPMHYWCFDQQTGKCTNIPGAELTGYPVEVRDGELVAIVA